jgi:short subunit dehydrogenase-like uncharacterized protein
MKNRFLLYGANGYTGRLVIDYANAYGLTPVLAGRNEMEIKQLAQETGYDHFVIELDDEEMLDKCLSDFDVVLHVAGPFSQTYKKMAEACLRTNTHYLDITGEIGVFQGLQSMDAAARQKGLMLLPGIGFDIVPTDCMAAYLASQMPGGQKLELGFQAGGGISRGTLNTALEGMLVGGMVRENGALKKVPHAYKVKDIDYGQGPIPSSTIPWGDVFTAYYSTGVPNVEVYMAGTRSLIRMQRISRYFSGLIRLAPVRKFAKNRIKAAPPGPSLEQRDSSVSRVWGQITDKENNKKSAIMITPNGYTLTAKTGLMAVQRILQGEFKAGFQTPSTAFGADFILDLEGCSLQDV